MKTNPEVKMFGCSAADLKKARDAHRVRFTAGGAATVLAADSAMARSILSDAQELLASDAEQARQLINRAKFLLMEMAK